MNTDLTDSQVIEGLKIRVIDLLEANVALETRIFDIRRRLEIALDEMERTKLGAFGVCKLKNFILKEL